MTFAELKTTLNYWQLVILCNENGYPIHRTDVERSVSYEPKKYDGYIVKRINPCKAMDGNDYSLQVFLAKPEE